MTVNESSTSIDASDAEDLIQSEVQNLSLFDVELSMININDELTGLDEHIDESDSEDSNTNRSIDNDGIALFLGASNTAGCVRAQKESKSDVSKKFTACLK